MPLASCCWLIYFAYFHNGIFFLLSILGVGFLFAFLFLFIVIGVKF